MNEYLSYQLLNEIEEKVEELHKLFKYKFNLIETSLRNIKVDDDLSNRMLYLNIPYDSHKYIDEEAPFIIVNNNHFICSKVSTSGNMYIGYKYQGHYNFIYYKFLKEKNNQYNYIRYKLPDDYGIVFNTSKSNRFYNCFKIKDDKYKVLEYTKKEWFINEIPYLQYIDHIEEGINDIADFFYKPVGYRYKEWTTTGYYNIEKTDYGVAQRPISINDINRWNKNIELLEDAFNSIFCVWNVVSYINWNEESEFSWEESNG